MNREITKDPDITSLTKIMEFKGTKETWYIYRENGEIYIECDRPNWTVAKTLSNFVEDEANALLISKAPEMLEKLYEIVQAIENETIIIQENEDNDGWENFGGRFYSEAKKLIKEATDLT